MTHLYEVLRWNDQLGLVSKRDPESACERLLLESLEILDWAHTRGDAIRQVADIGSGGGFPGLVWALSEPSWRVLLIERRTRKAGFLESTLRILGLENAEVFSGQVSEARLRRPKGSIDIAVAMAVGRVRTIVEELEPMLNAEGRFVTTCSVGDTPPADVGRSMVLRHVIEGRHGRYAEYARDPAPAGGSGTTNRNGGSDE